MNDKKRMGALLGVLAILAIANIFNWVSDDGFEGPGFFADELDPGFSPKFQRAALELERTPVLNFGADRAWEPVDVVDQRNPFIFGVDRKKEAEQKQRMEALEKQREALAAEPVPEVVTVVRPQFDGRVIGLMKSSGDGPKMVSISYNQEIHILKEGQVLAGKYRLIAVEDERVVLHGLETDEEIEIQVQTR